MSYLEQKKQAEEARLRNVLEVVRPELVVEGAGVKLQRTIASRALNYLDPFLLFDHFVSDNPDDYLAGFPEHPHRGIETVTYVLSGTVHHRDSLGNSGSIGAGDVQWMTAGRGILHEEMPRPQNGRIDGFQLWVNLPAKLKMTQPRYQEIPAGAIPTLQRQDGTRIRVIAGQAYGAAGPISGIAADPTYLDVLLPPNSIFVRSVEKGYTAFAYVFRGQGVFGATEDEEGQAVQPLSLIVFGDGDYLRIRTHGQPVRFLLICGRPSHESIVRYGPFVMNTPEEIHQALRDLQDGTFVQA